MVRVGIESEIPFIKYTDFLFNLSCLVDPCDMNAPKRDISTVFKHGISNKNPSGVTLVDVVQMSVDECRKHMGELHHNVQKHTCCMYFLRHGLCRFGFPLPIVENTYIMIVENV